MQSDVPLDYAIFQLSPRRSRCELFVSYGGTTEKLASGLVKPFVTHLKVAEEQVALAGKSINLEVERNKNAETWFTKGTLERFVRFVSTPEVLEMVNTFDAEMSQLEAARKIYSQGAADHEPGASGGVGNGAIATSDATKKELLRAIDVRCSAVKEDLITACSRASTAGFNPQTVSELQLFADHFGAYRLSEACSKFITLTQQRSDLFHSNSNTTLPWKASSDKVLRSSNGSDVSLDEPFDDQSRPATCTTTKIPLPSRRFSREPSPSPGPSDELNESENIKDKDFDKDKAVGSTTTDTTSTNESTCSSIGKPQLTRRLSVQERISLFENKAQTSPSSATTPTSTGGKPEFRRLSSDVNSSTTDKAVLRRWSGASGMSIDVNGERKEPDTNANIPTPSSALSSRPLFSPKSKDSTDPKLEEGNKDSKFSVDAKFDHQLVVPSGGESGVNESVLSESNSKIASVAGRSTRKDQSSGSGILSRAEEFGSPVQCESEENLESLSGKEVKPQGGITNFSGKSVTKIETKLINNQGVTNNDELKDQPVDRSRFSGFQKRIIDGSDSGTSEVHGQPVIKNIGVKVNPVPAQPRWRSLAEVDITAKKDSESSHSQTESRIMRKENSGSGSNQVTRGGAKRESGSTVIGNMEMFSSTSSVPTDQVQRVRQAKGTQGVNDDLKMKANELEKLYAEHKLRLPVDPSNSARRIRPTDMANEVGEPDKDSNEMETEKQKQKLNSTPLSKASDNHNSDVTPKHNICSISFSDDSKGKLYQKYMQKRNAKLKEDWSSNRPQKEAQMKAIHDSLEKSRAQMKVKLAGSLERSNSTNDPQRRDDKMRSFDVQSVTKNDQPTGLFMGDEDEDQAEFLGKKLPEMYSGDSSSKSIQNKRVQPNKNTSSPSTRNTTGPISRSSGKVSHSAAGRRRLPYDNPLAHSVPNFTDLKKENTRPSPGGSKPARLQVRNHARKKSSSEDILFLNEEKSRRFQALRKNTVVAMELNDSRNSDDVVDTQILTSKYNREENEDYERAYTDMETKTLPRKDNNIGHSFDGTEGMVDVAKDEEPDFETIIAVDNSKNGRLSHESDKSGNSGYENNNALGFASQVGPVSAAELPSTAPSIFRSMGSMLESPGESPGYWNACVQNPFAFSHEVSDIDASDSPSGSPASWNFHTVSQSETEAARMRKQWGASQKPVVGIDPSRSPSRKDVTRGLKRFLKFGRKNRASDNAADWISATTSEGDDSEDGRDLANRSSEDLRKSRMGFSQSHNSDEGLNGNDLFNEQVQALRSSIPTPPSNFKLRDEQFSGGSLKAPKSFFSLSNFRSKGNDSKPR